MKNLIIVESPTKARTIKAFLGSDYEVIASKGHIRDLPKFHFGIRVDEEKGRFAPEYEIAKTHQDIVNEMKRLSKTAQNIFIATDEDREGEAIGFHITKAIGADFKTMPRIVFHEITKTAIKNALANPRKIDIDKVNAQQARRLLDRIVGFKLSSLVASKIARKMSAGRVQSAALKIIVDREKEIKKFVPIIYFTIEADFLGVETHLVAYRGAKIKDQDLRDEHEAKKMAQILKNDDFKIGRLEKKQKNTPTPPPFMTSTLQQSASSALNFSPSRTMKIAQILYEGVATPDGHMGVITYMRTDSLNVAKEAVSACRKFISKSFGDEYLPTKAKIYATKNKAAQEAHEAIRPTNLAFTPQIAAKFLKPDEAKLYALIFNRFVASQMKDALFELQNISFIGENGEFRANGRSLIFDGFYKILGQSDRDKILPNFSEGEILKPQKVSVTEHATQPPPRFTESSLIKMLESLGIGRPSTYAPTISLLSGREYISIEKKQLVPQEMAFKLMDMLDMHFKDIVDSTFSASLETKLDLIAEKKQDWEAMLFEFYVPFMEKINAGKTEIASQKMAIEIGENCPLCEKPLLKRAGKYGEFIGCSGYPKCKFIKSEKSQEVDGTCEKCGADMVKKRGKNGEFLACSAYPECKNTKSLKNQAPAEQISIPCPKCGGEILKRRGRMGEFFGCKNYPKCDFVSKFLPSDARCPECDFVMAERVFRGKEIFECLAKDCRHKMPRESE